MNQIEEFTTFYFLINQLGASGRELFTFNPEMFEDEDDDAWEMNDTIREEGEEIDAELFAGEDLGDLDITDE